jgi:diguanylate cyclase (GGDEF)-like protein
LALEHHLGSCWSIPIVGGDGRVLGTFAVYHKKQSKPEKAQMILLQKTCATAAIAIEQRQLTDQLAYQAHHDPLTGLANRVLFQERLRQELALARRSGTQVALLYIDLDRFKLINDTLGHATGDAFLKQVAGRLKSCLRETDTLARISGDEFTVAVAGIKKPQHAGVVAEAILKGMREPFQVED